VRHLRLLVLNDWDFHLVDSKSLHAHPISSVFYQPRRRGAAGPREERTGRGRARRGEDQGGARRAPSTCEAHCLGEANWYPTRSVDASEAVQISANSGECWCQRVNPSPNETRSRSPLVGSTGGFRILATPNKPPHPLIVENELGDRPSDICVAHECQSAVIEDEDARSPR